MQNLSIKEIRDIISNCNIDEYMSYINILSKDKRDSVKKIALALSKKIDKQRSEEKRLEDIFQIEESLINKSYIRIGGIDEAGRGPLAGPVVAACVVLKNNPMIEGVNDSKKISAKNREIIFNNIISSGIEYGIGIADNNEIDEYNVLNATFLAMKRAILMSSSKPDFILVDGNQMIKDIQIPQKCIIEGDAKSVSIACASIIAKVTRDKIMDDYADIYKNYTFKKHKGYGTKQHIQEIIKYGITPIHRKSFLKNIY